jgi:Protein of unknown function (DUF2628)
MQQSKLPAPIFQTVIGRARCCGLDRIRRAAGAGRKTGMRVYSVHEPPVRGLDPLPDAERFVFVRDGFYFRAFLFAPLWMLWRQMWLVLAGYLILSAVVETALVMVGATPADVVVVALLISLLVGLEASTLRRFTLTRGGWKYVGIVSGDDLEDAERRYFETWVLELPAQRAVPMAAPPSTPPESGAPPPRAPQGSGVIGLFPEPGASR